MQCAFLHDSSTSVTISPLLKMIKTRFCMISDTHSQVPLPESDTEHAYRFPLPSADVLLHAGDLTIEGGIKEYKGQLAMLKAADAELKIVIAGNHDLSLDAEYCANGGASWAHLSEEDVATAKALWTSEEARRAGVMYLEEGLNQFELKNGAKFSVSAASYDPFMLFHSIVQYAVPKKCLTESMQIYTSPYTPEYGNMGFPYQRDEDRFNSAEPESKFQAVNPIPPWPEVDIVLTHGPPAGIRDRTFSEENAGCENLMTAMKRCRPRLHCFGHIHEGRGAERYDWISNSRHILETSRDDDIEHRASFVDLTAGSENPLTFGKETLFVNAAIMNLCYEPLYAPWVVDLDLPAVDKTPQNG